MVTLVVGDDHEIFVDALISALPRWGCTVAGSGGSVAATMAALDRHRPDVCLLDRYFVDGDGIDAIEQAVSISPETKIVMLTADGDSRGTRTALNHGAVGYVNKTRGLAALVEAVHAVLRGEIVVELAASTAAPPAGTTHALRLVSQLTVRERQCLELLVEGVPTDAMAKRLCVSQTTVRTHVQAILTKLGVHSRLEVAAFVLRHSLLDLGGESPSSVATSVY